MKSATLPMDNASANRILPGVSVTSATTASTTTPLAIVSLYFNLVAAVLHVRIFQPVTATPKGLKRRFATRRTGSAFVKKDLAGRVVTGESSYF